MKVYFLFIGIVFNLNILQIYPNCNPHNVIGVCRAYWAYSIADLATIQNCIQNEGLLESKLSPQVLINNIVSDSNQECVSFQDISVVDKALKYAQELGIGSDFMTPDVSYYLGKKVDEYIGYEYPQKIGNVEEIESSDVEREIMENQGTPMIVMQNSIELMFDDVSTKKLETGSGSLISFLIVGFDQINDKKVFILQNNFNDNWTNNGFTQIQQDDPNIVKIYKVEVNQF